MNICIGYKEYPKPDFFQGPTYIIFKEQSKIKNHKYPEDKEDPDEELCYDVVQFPPIKVRQFPPPKPNRKVSDHGAFSEPKKKKKTEEDHHAPIFDIKTEKKKSNKFWKEN